MSEKRKKYTPAEKAKIALDAIGVCQGSCRIRLLNFTHPY